MNEEQRLDVRREVKLCLEEERNKEEQNRIVQDEKAIKDLPAITGITSIVMALIMSFVGTYEGWSYLMYFSLFFLPASVISFLVVRAKFLLNTKRWLLLIPILIYVFGIILPIIFLESGIM